MRLPLLTALLCSAFLGCGSESNEAPATADSLLERGRIQREREDFPAAEKTYTEALAVAADETEDDRVAKAELYMERGIARERQERLADAEEDYSAALELDPKLARAWNNRAWVRAGQGRVQQALKDWDQALAVDPADELALANRAMFRQQTEDYEGALEDVETWERLSAGSFGPAYRKGTILLAKGETDAAIEALREAIRRGDATPDVDPSAFASVWWELSTALRQAGKPREAGEAWAEAVRRDSRLAATQEAVANLASEGALDALQEAGFVPTGDPPPRGFDLVVSRDGGEPTPVLLAEAGDDGGFLLSVEELTRLEQNGAAWIAVQTENGSTLHRAAEALRRGPRPVRFLIPADGLLEAEPFAIEPAPTPAPAPPPVAE
ncbi:tetratricopeptide repeat protein [Alienimonas chondri]|uniref:Tetratricopeptide repeat protein n=1 Tax=Alienimonas chondri TaxID=2681879 RepID=A0ABX1VJ57_9PLAN|nr:tetratricopeptide repeat protein [Alienimonas chondri]NNJ27802.1 hypothetical protein [Alienimonas chondri]